MSQLRPMFHEAVIAMLHRLMAAIETPGDLDEVAKRELLEDAEELRQRALRLRIPIEKYEQ